ncbi:transcriptional repressor AgaR [Vibrio sp. HN007]|uniref:transcriptional repressor AgaR n=1 Tax=Vibrio iocasae TaxID=3098914 RepID=UPI0035D4B1E0
MTKTAQRREEILETIQTSGIGNVEYFAEKYQVSSVTIRNDLNELEKRGCVVRCYGGATINKNFAFDRSLKEKGQIRADVKLKIAKKAEELIDDGDNIILDSGSTTEKIAQQLKSDKQLVVMTNAINIAYHLTSFENVEVMVTGGTVRKNAFSLHGENAEEQLGKYRFDKLFLGVDGFDLDLGVTTPHKGEALVNRAMCKVAKTVIAVCDSSKFDRKSFCIIATLEEVDVLITDNGIPLHYVDALKANNIEVIIAE